MTFCPSICTDVIMSMILVSICIDLEGFVIGDDRPSFTTSDGFGPPSIETLRALMLSDEVIKEAAERRANK